LVTGKNTVALIACVLAISSAYSIADEAKDSGDRIRVLSWNISGDAFVSEQREFQSLLSWADPDLVLLDEVQPSAKGADLLKSFDTLHPNTDEIWTVDIGVSGGRQRCVVASRVPQEALPEFASIIPYPDADRRYLLEHMSDDDLEYSKYSLDGGIPVTGRSFLTAIGDSWPSSPTCNAVVAIRAVGTSIVAALKYEKSAGLFSRCCNAHL